MKEISNSCLAIDNVEYGAESLFGCLVSYMKA